MVVYYFNKAQGLQFRPKNQTKTKQINKQQQKTPNQTAKNKPMILWLTGADIIYLFIYYWL